MTDKPIGVRPTDIMDEVLDVLADYKVFVVPVVDKRGHCVGVLSVSNLLDLARKYVSDSGEDLGRFATVHHSALIEQLRKPEFAAKPVSEFMAAAAPLTVGPDILLRDAADKMVHDHVHHLFVTDTHGMLLGVISTIDILRGLLRISHEV